MFRHVLHTEYAILKLVLLTQVQTFSSVSPQVSAPPFSFMSSAGFWRFSSAWRLMRSAGLALQYIFAYTPFSPHFSPVHRRQSRPPHLYRRPHCAHGDRARAAVRRAHQGLAKNNPIRQRLTFHFSQDASWNLYIRCKAAKVKVAAFAPLNAVRRRRIADCTRLFLIATHPTAALAIRPRRTGNRSPHGHGSQR